MNGNPTGLPGAVLFDMDGLLVETESLWFQAETTIVTDLGGIWTDAHSVAMVGGPVERAVAYMIEQVEGEHDLLVVRDRLLSTMEELLRTEPIHWRPGARDLLLALQERAVPCALVSASWRALVDAVLDAVSHDVGADIFATTVAADDLPRTKPHPDPYLEAARRLGVEPLDCVVLEDSHTGVQAGLASGALVVAVPSYTEIPPSHGMRQVGSLTELSPELLGEWSTHWRISSAA